MKTRSLSAAALLILGVAACAPGTSSTDEASLDGPEFVHVEGLGSLSFPNSGAAAAQDAFHRGVLLLHSFEYEPAAEAFREAQEIDPEFALAYWGEAMTYNHPLWQQQDGDAANAALSGYAATAAERADRAPTARERGYLQAVDILYNGTGDKAARDRAYMEAMATLATEYPQDLEARAFWALSILGSVDGVRDFATYMRAAATAQPVFDANPDHPGAAHYLIHSFDDPVHAPLGMPAARAYSEIAPRAAHAQHMTSHIFVATGLWDDVVAANIRASDVQDAALAEQGRGPNVCGHYSSWLHYGYLMLGEIDRASTMMDACHQGIVEGSASPVYFAMMRARQIIDTEDWALAERWPADLPAEGTWAGSSPRFLNEFTNALAAIRSGNAAPARALVASYEGPAEGAGAVQVLELRGLLAIDAGRRQEGLELLRRAAAAEDALPFEFGPPHIVKPTFELLGEELLAAGDREGAAAAFRRALERTPGRTLAERGLTEATASD
jgi:tetratricopeptide (TPR) repeat protein